MVPAVRGVSESRRKPGDASARIGSHTVSEPPEAAAGFEERSQGRWPRRIGMTWPSAEAANTGAARLGGSNGVAQGVTFGFESFNASLEFEDATDASEVDALFLAHALHVTQALHVAFRVAPPRPFVRAGMTRPRRSYCRRVWGVHPRQLGGDRDDEG